MAPKFPFEEFQNAFNPETAERVKAQAQEIWLAGLGAFSKAQEEGSKAFEKLVKDGVNMQRKTQAAAGEKIAEMTERMATLADDVTDRASSQWGRLEGIFEERVAKALARLNVPSAQDVAALKAQIAELQATLDQLGIKPRPSVRAGTRKAMAHTETTTPDKT